MKITILLIVIVFMLPVSMPIMAETGTDDFKTTLLKAEQGQLNAQFNLGLIYELGLGIPKNTVVIVEVFKSKMLTFNSWRNICRHQGRFNQNGA